MKADEPDSFESSSLEVPKLIEHLFRQESGRLVSILVRRLGVRHLQLSEDVVQDALLKAVETWPYTGVPQNPSVWLLQTAKHRAFDNLRRATVWRGKQENVAALVEAQIQLSIDLPFSQFEDEIRDSQLRMMFICCQPELGSDAQVALILRTLCGFGEKEIAAAFLSSEAAVNKRLVRARRVLRDTFLPLELPAADELRGRLDRVLQSLYLLFNEGYKASSGTSLLRADLCAEAIRLGEILAEHPTTCAPETHALVALMHMNAARLTTRVDQNGSLLLLADQDRSRWDQRQIHIGLQYLRASGVGETVTRFHLEAGIAACHCLASDFVSTDWRHIRKLYDLLLGINNSPVVALNRAVAVVHADGADAGLQALQEISIDGGLDHYYLYHAVAAHILAAARRPIEAEISFDHALRLAGHPAERDFLRKRLAVFADNSW